MRGFAFPLGGGPSDDDKPAELPVVEAQVTTLREIYQNFLATGTRFRPGDLVTPRAGAQYLGAGQPFIVLEVRENPELTNQRDEDSSSAYGNRLDVRVMGYHEHSGHIGAWWQESMWLEPYVGQPDMAKAA